MPQRRAKTYDIVKRSMDMSVSAVALVLTAPVQLIAATIVLATLGRPVLFRQRRPGRHGVVFEVIKSRTMLEQDDAHQTDAERLTKVGRFLRATSLDELPTLVNVFRGDMSLVGPRPLLIEYLPLYSEQQSRRHEVRPGITGLAQINGRNLLIWEKKFERDVEYVDKRSFSLDLKILLLTIAKVFAREGISSADSRTPDMVDGAGVALSV